MQTNSVSTQPDIKTGVSVTVEALDPNSYTDLIKRRKPGQKYRPAQGNERAIQVNYKDLIVISRFHNERFGKVGQAVDSQVEGFLQQTIDASDFTGKQGETLVVDLEAHGLGSGNARKALIVGLGNRPDCEQLVFCGFVSAVLKESAALNVEQVLLPLDDVASAATAARFASVLQCRTDHHLATAVEHGRLKKIRIVVAPESFAAAEAALRSKQQLCRVCSEPEL